MDCTQFIIESNCPTVTAILNVAVLVKIIALRLFTIFYSLKKTRSLKLRSLFNHSPPSNLLCENPQSIVFIYNFKSFKNSGNETKNFNQNIYTNNVTMFNKYNLICTNSNGSF